MQEKNSIELIEYELTTFIRRAVYLDNSENKIGNLERSAYLLLRQLDEFGPARVKELAEAFKLDISTLSRQAAALENKKLISRSSDPSDGRVSLFNITTRGKQMLQTDKQMRLERYHSMLKKWSSEEKELFGKLLMRMNDAFID
ncbi:MULTISPECIES: MarR family winged helix-turn-helix transcriptional regulator [Priestia]|uniref:MarR family winged helix-turn-helix transcriptional regulator n=1 Tax=Priestia TaxID=2800373 RepID=UPI0011BAF723|nr:MULTISPECIES: MarR family transcriptional regulator [Priestia]MCM3772734.1 MarR family transcriptional regulator [Priestia aryabhattai]MDY0941471.1 MarR family transcriptional regulator [Priestia megaterium]MED5244319.1 MarR family transcriptional regulator [Priestia sp. LL-8]QDZ80820.1 MarR family transcriptional regulator [Priestia megaterium]WKG33277.1 MarR family transcriptional regulator [Priestia aryabhattai]